MENLAESYNLEQELNGNSTTSLDRIKSRLNTAQKE